ncbi:MAG: hypothetical protein ACRYHQ_24285 [Janthinobacterium lividum]
MSPPRLAPPPPPDEPQDPTPSAIERFIAAAPGKTGPRPWLQPGVRADVRTSYSIRSPEILTMKLDWLAALEKKRRNEIIINALEAYARAELSRLGEEQ